MRLPCGIFLVTAALARIRSSSQPVARARGLEPRTSKRIKLTDGELAIQEETKKVDSRAVGPMLMLRLLESIATGAIPDLKDEAASIVEQLKTKLEADKNR